MLEGEPLTRELHPGTDIARNWTVITAAYSGLEQTLKYLIAEERDLTIAELINYSAPKRTGNIECETGKYPYRTHNLGRLYSELEESTRNIVQDFYGRFQSLHSYDLFLFKGVQMEDRFSEIPCDLSLPIADKRDEIKTFDPVSGYQSIGATYP